MMLLLNVCLAVAWAAIRGDLSVANLLIGFVIGYVILGVTHNRSGRVRYFTKVAQILRFGIYFLWQLVVATLRVAVDVVTPKYRMRPAILAVPIESRSDGETTMLANAITLTPGSLTLDVSADGKTLFVHVMHASNIEGARQEIQRGFGKRVHEVFE